MYSVYQHWDPLKVCIVGKSYSPKFYDYIKNNKVRRVFYRIAEETEEDYQLLIKKLESFNIDILRPEVSDEPDDHLDIHGRILPPPMTPRDYTAMIGNNFYIDYKDLYTIWQNLKGDDWPECPKNINQVSDTIKQEFKLFNFNYDTYKFFPYRNFSYDKIISHLKTHANVIFNKQVNSAVCARIGKDLYFGTEHQTESCGDLFEKYSPLFPDHRVHIIPTEGHTDGTFCLVHPGLIVSLYDIPNYEKNLSKMGNGLSTLSKLGSCK